MIFSCIGKCKAPLVEVSESNGKQQADSWNLYRCTASTASLYHRTRPSASDIGTAAPRVTRVTPAPRRAPHALTANTATGDTSQAQSPNGARAADVTAAGGTGQRGAGQGGGAGSEGRRSGGGGRGASVQRHIAYSEHVELLRAAAALGTSIISLECENVCGWRVIRTVLKQSCHQRAQCDTFHEYFTRIVSPGTV